MILSDEFEAIRVDGTVKANAPVSSGLLRLDLELDQALPSGAGFLPGQFAMINLPGARAMVFSRPFSILAWEGRVVSFLYRVVGTGTRAMADLETGSRMTFLGPLGKPFPELADDQAAVLIGGGVGLPPVAAWLARHGRPQDRGYFGGRDGADVPWSQLLGSWQVSVDTDRDVPQGKKAYHGLVTELVAQDQSLDASFRRVILTCGPIPMLKAAARLAADRGWDCYVSLEEHMGCGYGACKGCVVPVTDITASPGSWRNATCCQEGPVFPAGQILWERYGKNEFATVE
jgi:dihydroorotate dehydrogenase electron transfer subunit